MSVFCPICNARFPGEVSVPNHLDRNGRLCGVDSEECASRPAWTTTPPTEPGKWFWRFVGDIETHVAELDNPASEDYPFDFEDPAHPREWWPVPIPEPPR